MANSLHVKKGDRVKVIAGRDKGKIGEILSVDPVANRVVVEGVHVVTRHKPESTNAAGKKIGGIVTAEAPIHVSNVQLVVKVEGKKDVLTRIGYERREVTKKRSDGTLYQGTRSVRIAKKTGEEI